VEAKTPGSPELHRPDVIRYGAMMNENPLLKLEAFGQSVWLDYIHRHLMESGELDRLIAEDGLSGITSNPSIFDEAIEGGDAYDDAIRGLARAGKSVGEIYETIATEDVGRAADVLGPVFDKRRGRDGFVSIEVDPRLAREEEATVGEARRLWERLTRPNVMIKVPATMEGLGAIRRIIGEGVNVNVTLLFALPRYRMVAEAYIAGLEDRAARGLPVANINSVASFFLSRIDTLVDPMLEKNGAPDARKLRGQMAVSSARVAYQMYKEIFTGERFAKLAKLGACPQRLLWASTGTKDPQYSDVKYVDALIGPETVNTMPRKTLEAYRDHGDPKPRLEEDLDQARSSLDRLAGLGIDLEEVTRRLEEEGIEKFKKPFESLMANIQKKCGGLDLPGA
jgi:transaldolase